MTRTASTTKMACGISGRPKEGQQNIWGQVSCSDCLLRLFLMVSQGKFPRGQALRSILNKGHGVAGQVSCRASRAACRIMYQAFPSPRPSFCTHSASSQTDPTALALFPCGSLPSWWVFWRPTIWLPLLSARASGSLWAV